MALGNISAERHVLNTMAKIPAAQLQDALLADFPELAPGFVLGTVTRSRRDLARLGPCEGLWDAVELVARQRLLEALGSREPVRRSA